MTAAELIAELQKVPPDTQIRVFAGHGQTCMQATTCGVQLILQSDLGNWKCDTLHEGERDEYYGADLVEVFEVGAP